MRTIYWWPLSTCATNLRRREKQNWNRDFGGKVDQVGEAGQSRALPGHLCWICIFCTFVFLSPVLDLYFLFFYISSPVLDLYFFVLLCFFSCVGFVFVCTYTFTLPRVASEYMYISCVVLVVFIFIAG